MNGHDLATAQRPVRRPEDKPDHHGPFPDGFMWCTDGQGNSWGHFPEETIDLHWSVIFFAGFFVGAIAVWSLWYVW